MGSPTNIGNQKPFFHFHFELKGETLTDRVGGLIEPGIYSGHWISIETSSSIRVRANPDTTSVIEISDGNVQAKFEFQSDYVISVTSEKPILIYRYQYKESDTEIYAEPKMVSLSEIMPNDLIVGEVVFDGDNAVGVSYNLRSVPAFHWYRFSQVFTNQGQRLPRQDHFVSCSLGSPQGVYISTGVDPVTTGGKTAGNNLRIISNIGIEDATGILWQWGSEGGTNKTTAYSNAYDANDKNVGGQEYSNVTRPVFGGYWQAGVACGSRNSIWAHVGLALNLGLSGRGFAEPK